MSESLRPIAFEAKLIRFGRRQQFLKVNFNTVGSLLRIGLPFFRRVVGDQDYSMDFHRLNRLMYWLKTGAINIRKHKSIPLCVNNLSGYCFLVRRT